MDLAAALPPTYHVLTGPNLARDDDAGGYYATTRLIWGGGGTSPSSDIQGALTGFEVHLLSRYSVAQRLFVTVALSAVFGTFLTMLLTLLLPAVGQKIVLVMDRSGDQAALGQTPPALPSQSGMQPEQPAGQRADEPQQSESTRAFDQVGVQPIHVPTSIAASTTARPLTVLLWALALSLVINRYKRMLAKPNADRALPASRAGPSERDKVD